MRAAVARAVRARLALEHEAVWLAGLVGGRFPDLRDDARSLARTHARRRDRLRAVLATADAPAPRVQLAYGTPPTSVDAAREAVADLQQRLAAAALAHVGVVAAGAREEPLRALRAAALSAVDWGADPDPFPGLP